MACGYNGHIKHNSNPDGIKMKTVLVRVRLTEEQVERLHELEEIYSFNNALQRSVTKWLDSEGAVYLAALRKAQAEIGERQPVMPVRAAELKAVQR